MDVFTSLAKGAAARSSCGCRFSFWRNCQPVLQNAIWFPYPLAMHGGLASRHLSITSCCCCVSFQPPERHVISSQLYLHLPQGWWCEAVPSAYLPPGILLGEMYVRASSSFSNWVLYFTLQSFESSLYILSTSQFSDPGFADIPCVLFVSLASYQGLFFSKRFSFWWSWVYHVFLLGITVWYQT